MKMRMLLLLSTAFLVFSGPAAAQQPTLSDIAACNEYAVAKTTPSPLAGGASLAAAEETDPSGSVITKSPDPLVIGMDAGRADDLVYRAAYRLCMARRTALRR
jgi:hypothetical protein